MQITVNLVAGQRQRMDLRGRMFLIVAQTIATTIAVTLLAQNTELETVNTAGRGFKARTFDEFDAVELKAEADTKIEIIVSKGVVDFDFVSGAAVTVSTLNGAPLPVSNDRGTPGNLLHVTGVSLSDAPAAAMTANGPVAITNAGQQIAPADAARRTLRIANLGPDPMTIGPVGITWAKRTLVLNAGDVWIEERGGNLAWHGITDAGKTASATWQGVTA